MHIWTIVIPYLDDWYYIAGRCVLRISTVVMERLRFNGLSKIEMAFQLHDVVWKCMLLYIIIKGIKNGWPCIVEIRGTQGLCKSHSQPVQCTRPSHCQRQQWRHNPIELRDVTIATQRTLLGAHVNGTEIVLKSTDRRSNISLFLHVQGLIHGCLIVFISRVIRWNCFSKMWRISLPRMLQNNDLQC